MENTFSNYYSPHPKFNYNTDYNQNSSCLVNQDQFSSSSFNQQPRMALGTNRNQTNLPQSTTQRSHLKPASKLILLVHNQDGHYQSNTKANGLHQLNSSHHPTNHLTTNSIKSTNHTNLNNKREIPRLPNASPRPTTSHPQTCSSSSSTTSTSYSTVQQKNSLQSPNFDKSAISGLKATGANSKIQRLSGNYSVVTQPSSPRSSPIMSTAVSMNAKLNKQSNQNGSISNLSIRSSNLRSSVRSTISNTTDRNERAQSKTRSFGLNAKHSLSKTNLNKSNLNLNSHSTTNTLSSHQPNKTTTNNFKSSNLPKSLSGSTNALADTNNKRTLIKPKNVSCLPAPKSRPISAYLSDEQTTEANCVSKTRSALKSSNSNSSRTSSNLNLNIYLEKSSSTANSTLTKSATNAIKTKDTPLNDLKKSLNKKPVTSSSIKSTMHNLTQSSTISTPIYKPFATLSNSKSKQKSSVKDAKSNDLESNDNVDKQSKTNEKLNKSLSESNYPYVNRNSSPEKCSQLNNIARVSPIRREYQISSNVKRQLNGSLNSSDQEDELDDDLFETENSLNQQTSDDANSFDSENAKYYAVLSSSEDEKLNGTRRSREREEKRLRRVSGQRTRSDSSKRSSPILPEKNEVNKSKDDVLKVNERKSSKSNKESTKLTTTPTLNKSINKFKCSNSNLNKSNSSSINTIDHKSTSLNTMFPTLNRLHNSNSIQQLNSVNAVNSVVGKSNNKTDEQDYQSDDAEQTLYKLKSLDFNCNSYSANKNSKEKSTNDKDGNNNSLIAKSSSDHQANEQTNERNNNDFNSLRGTLETPALSSLLSNYMSRSIGSLTGSLNGLNNFNNLSNLNNLSLNQSHNQTGTWSTMGSNLKAPCSTSPLLPQFRSANSPNHVYQSSLLTTNAAIPASFQHLNSSFTPQSNSSIPNTVINNIQNNIQNTTLNNISSSNMPPSSFSSRLIKYGENRGSSVSLVSACSSNYSNNMSITSNQTLPQYQQQRPLSDLTSNSFLDKTVLNEIKHLKNELNRANEKINLLKSQLVTSGQMVTSFEQSLQTKTSRMKHYALKLEEKDREIESLKALIDNLKKTYNINIDVNYRSDTNSPVPYNYYNNSPNLHNSNSLHNSQANSSDGETSSIKGNKAKQQDKKQGKKRSNSKKSRSNSANSSDEDDTASVHSKDGNLNNSISWFKNPITRAFKKKHSNRSKNGSNQELDKTADSVDNGKYSNDCKKHPQHPSQLHQSYIQQDQFKNDLNNELIELKSQLTDERLKSLAKEDEIMKLKECFNHLQTELFSLRKQANL